MILLDYNIIVKIGNYLPTCHQINLAKSDSRLYKYFIKNIKIVKLRKCTLNQLVLKRSCFSNILIDNKRWHCKMTKKPGSCFCSICNDILDKKK